MEVEDNENIQQNMPLKNVYESIVPKLPLSKEVDPRLEIDRNERKLQVFLQNNRPMLTVGDLKRFMPCTINVDPYLRKLIKEQLQNAENMSYEYGLFPSNAGSCDMFGWPCSVRRPTSRAESSPRATPTMRPVSALRGLLGAATPCPVPPYGLYPPAHFLPYGQALPYGPNVPSAVNAPQNARATPQINLQGGMPTDSLTTMTVHDVCNLLSRLEGLDQSRLPSYMACFQENNISGPVLMTCEIAELKSVLRMTFGDWELFRTLIQVLREREMSCESARGQDPNIAGEDGTDGKIKFTQEIRSDNCLSIPQPSYPASGIRKQTADQKVRDSFSMDHYKYRPNQLLKKHSATKLNVVGEHSELGYSHANSIPEGKRMTRKDSFFGEVMLESAALRSVVEAVGVYTDTGDDSEEDTQKEESPESENSSSHQQNMTSPSGQKRPSMVLSKQAEEDPRYKLGDSESGDSDSEEVFLLSRKTSSKRRSKTKSPSNLPRLKINNMKSVTVSNESLSGISKESTLNSRMTASRESVLKATQNKSLSIQTRPPKIVQEDDKAPLLRRKDSDHSSNERRSLEGNVPSTDSHTIEAPRSDDGSLPLTASPTPSCEHLALRLLSNSDSFTVPSAFKSVTPTSSRASSRASSLCLSHASSKAILKEDIEDSMRMNTGTNSESVGSVNVSRKSSYTCSPQPMSDVQDGFDNCTDADQPGNVIV